MTAREEVQIGMAKLAVLAYHKIGDSPQLPCSAEWYVPTSTLRRHLEWLSGSEWTVISARQFTMGTAAPETLPSRSVLLTFDDGYKSLVDNALPLLDKFRFPSVAFVPTGLVGGYNEFDSGSQPPEPLCSWDDLKLLERHDCSVESHTVHHCNFEITPIDQVKHEIIESKKSIENTLNKQVSLFAYPYGKFRDRSLTGALLKEAGYRAAFLFPGQLIAVPWRDVYFLDRIGVFPDTDLASALS